MVKDIGMLIASIILFLGVVCIFNARWIVKSKLNSSFENMSVNIVKVLGYIACIASLVFMYYLN